MTGDDGRARRYVRRNTGLGVSDCDVDAGSLCAERPRGHSSIVAAPFVIPMKDGNMCSSIFSVLCDG